MPIELQLVLFFVKTRNAKISTESLIINKSWILGTLTWGQISKKNFEVGPEVVQPGPELVQPGPEVVQVGPLLVHSNISSTVEKHFNPYSVRKLSLPDQAIQVLCDSIRMAPAHWGAWLELSCLVTSRDKLAGLYLPDHWCKQVNPWTMCHFHVL